MRFFVLFAIQSLRSFSFSRFWNLTKLCVSFLCRKNFRQTMPAFVSVEPTNICNLHCPECPTGNGQSAVRKGKIAVETVRRIAPQMQKSVWFANVYFQGEPLVNEDAAGIVTELSRAGIMTSLSTNAHFLSEETAERLVAARLTKLIVSLDGYDQESYEKYRQGGSFEKVIEGLENIRKAKVNANSRFPLVEVQCLLFSHTEHHKAEIERIAKDADADKVTFKTAQFYGSRNIDMVPSEKNSRYTKQDGELKLKPSKMKGCWKQWSSCVVAWNGNVLPCCFDKDHAFVFGNVSSTDFREIWESERYTRFRTSINRNRSLVKMCQNCGRS